MHVEGSWFDVLMPTPVVTSKVGVQSVDPTGGCQQQGHRGFGCTWGVVVDVVDPDVGSVRVRKRLLEAGGNPCPRHDDGPKGWPGSKHLGVDPASDQDGRIEWNLIGRAAGKHGPALDSGLKGMAEGVATHAGSGRDGEMISVHRQMHAERGIHPRLSRVHP